MEKQVLLAIFVMIFLIGMFVSGNFDGTGFTIACMISAGCFAFFNFAVIGNAELKAQTKTPTPCKTSDNAAEIANLHDLLKSGALTQEEFDAEKKKNLGRAA
jgi:hypothetical protein